MVMSINWVAQKKSILLPPELCHFSPPGIIQARRASEGQKDKDPCLRIFFIVFSFPRSSLGTSIFEAPLRDLSSDLHFMIALTFG